MPEMFVVKLADFQLSMALLVKCHAVKTLETLDFTLSMYRYISTYTCCQLHGLDSSEDY